jgi:molybdopterin molybdotransferase
MVCFEVFARAAVELLSGLSDAPLPLTSATLSEDFKHRAGLTRFLPARLDGNGAEITPIRWSGSGDMAATARANCFLVAESDRPEYKRGDTIRLLLRH